MHPIEFLNVLKLSPAPILFPLRHPPTNPNPPPARSSARRILDFHFANRYDFSEMNGYTDFQRQVTF